MALFDMLTAWPVLIAALLFLVAYRVYRASTDPLRDVPGPYLARYTRLWYLRAILRGDWEKTNIALHRKHGPIVRIGPNLYSFDDPDATSIIYGTQPTFPKSKWYSVFQPPGKQYQNIYSSSDNKFAAEVRKKYKPAYDAVGTYEPCVDECISLLISKLADLSSKGENVDIGWWLKCFTTDVNGLIMYGKRFGHLDEGKDIGKVSSALEDRKNYGVTVGIFPGLHSYFWMLIAALSFVMRQIDYTLVFTQQRIEEHQADIKEKKGTSAGPIAMLTRFLDAHNQRPEWFTDQDVLIGALTAIVAGADTTEITLGSVFHYLYEYPECLKNLRAEIESANISDPVTYNETKQMPYMNAVIKEALRMHSPAGTPLWRTVPKPGFTLSGRFFPEGTTVGVNVWVSQHSSAFEPDPDTFRPERWLEADPKTLARMNKSHIVFGIGPRNCQGELIARMEMSKVILQLLRTFDFEIVGEWRLHNNWFVNYEGLTGKIKMR